jgi:hypothetical protein
MYKYFVSFLSADSSGNIVIDVTDEIKNGKHIEKIEKEISNKIHKKVVVMNFILLEKAVNKDE